MPQERNGAENGTALQKDGKGEEKGTELSEEGNGEEIDVDLSMLTDENKLSQFAMPRKSMFNSELIITYCTRWTE